MSTHNIASIIEQCRQERNQFRHSGTKSSPGCVELFRRALAGDQAAWTSVQSIFNDTVLAWIGNQTEIEPEDIAQEAWLRFYRYSQRPDFVLSDRLEAVLEYLRHCTKTSLLLMLRKQKDPLLELSEMVTDHTDFTAQVTLRAVIQDRLHELLPTAKERIICLLRYGCNWSARQIYAEHEAEFDSIDEVYQGIQRITRRLRKDQILQDLAGRAEKGDDEVFLKMSLLDESSDDRKRDRTVTDLCLFDEAILLDYITGLAPAELRAQIEASPACVQAVRALAGEIQPLLPLLQRALCPDAEGLVDYHAKVLTGTEQLVVRGHVTDCPLCQAELQELDRMETVPLFASADSPASPFAKIFSILDGARVREVIEAIFQPPTQLPQPVRGDMYLYQTPQVTIHLGMRRATGKARTWTLRGELRTPEGGRFGDAQSVLLWSHDVAEDEEGALQIVPDQGVFVFRELMFGRYSLHILTAMQEIIIREIVIGNPI